MQLTGTQGGGKTSRVRSIPILLTGMPGAGKTTSGALLARLLDVPFLDLDSYYEDVYAAPPAEHIVELGEPEFRKREAKLLRKVLTESPRVVACGGGTLAQPESLREALRKGLVVYLKASTEALAARLGDSSRHPLLAPSSGEDSDHRPLDSARGRPSSDLRKRLADLLSLREPSYRRAHRAVETEGRSPFQVALTIREALAALRPDGYQWTCLPPEFRKVGRGAEAYVELGHRTHMVRLSSGQSPHAHGGFAGLAAFLEMVAGGFVAVLVDKGVLARYGSELEAELAGTEHVLIPIPAGEEAKRFSRMGFYLRALLEAGLGRSDTVVAVGGGSALDAAGLAASLYMRGVRVVSVPTTLLAGVDAAVGGKTAADLPGAGSFRGAKNLAGTFRAPAGVFVPVEVIAREVAERRNPDGLAEYLKTALLAGWTDALERKPNLTERGIESMLARCIEFKIAVVVRDEEERTGARTLLNLGHTFAHAIEAASGYRVPHGQAVGRGLVMAARASMRLGFANLGLDTVVERAAKRYGLWPSEPGVSAAAAARHLSSDKKRAGSRVRMVLLSDVGKATVVSVPISVVENLMASCW